MKITDKMRLDWILNNWSGSRSNGSPWRMELQLVGGEKFTSKGPYFRRAIDAAIRANPKKGRSK